MHSITLLVILSVAAAVAVGSSPRCYRPNVYVWQNGRWVCSSQATTTPQNVQVTSPRSQATRAATTVTPRPAEVTATRSVCVDGYKLKRGRLVRCGWRRRATTTAATAVTFTQTIPTNPNTPRQRLTAQTMTTQRAIVPTTEVTTSQPVPPEPRVENVFIPMTPHPSDSKYCCRAGPYNVTRQHIYTEDVRVPYISSRRVRDGIRSFCPSFIYPDRPTVEDCYYYKQQTYMAYQSMSREITRYTTEEYYCRIADLTECCQGYVSYNDDCLSQADYDRLIALMGSYGRK